MNNVIEETINEAKNESGIIIIKHPLVELEHKSKFKNYEGRIDILYTPNIKVFMGENNINTASVIYCEESNWKIIAENL